MDKFQEMTKINTPPCANEHPASSIDEEAAAEVFAASISGEGDHWDKTMIAMHPEMREKGNENAWYVIDRCIEMGLCDEEPDPGSKEEANILKKWSEIRAPECKRKLKNLPLEGDHIRAFRMIDCNPENIRSQLGVFWSYTLENWDDPVTPWGDPELPTLLIEALVPLEAVEWQTTCLANMDWMIGDTESELRLKPGYPVKEVKISYLRGVEEITVPDISYTT